jgi:hypothetical protein
MIKTKIYDTYRGPQLLKATIDDKDILFQVNSLYGLSHNWNNTLYTIKDLKLILNKDVIGSTIYLEFVNKHGHKDWTRMHPKDDNEILNNPNFMPFNQNLY